MPFILSWLKYISWLKYANEAMTIIQWEGVTNISKHSDWSIRLDFDFFKSYLSFVISACNFAAQLPCIATAEEIYDQYNFDENNFSIDFYALTALYVAFNVFAFVLLWLRVRKYWWNGKFYCWTILANKLHNKIYRDVQCYTWWSFYLHVKQLITTNL